MTQNVKEKGMVPFGYPKQPSRHCVQCMHGNRLCETNVVRHGNVFRIHSKSIVTNPTFRRYELYYILMSLSLHGARRGASFHNTIVQVITHSASQTPFQLISDCTHVGLLPSSLNVYPPCNLSNAIEPTTRIMCYSLHVKTASLQKRYNVTRNSERYLNSARTCV